MVCKSKIPMRNICVGVLAFSVISLGSCAPTIAGYQEQAYKNATTLKAETYALMGKSDSEEFSNNADNVASTTVAIDAAYNYASGISKNGLSASQWSLYKSGIYDKFVATWKAQGKTNKAYREEQQINSNIAFDYIICLEANKQTSTTCKAAGDAK